MRKYPLKPLDLFIWEGTANEYSQVRLVVGGDYRRVLIGSAIVGAIFLLWADIVARTIMAPEDLPIGIVTGIIGGIFFVWLLRRNSINKL